ncbi:hypothetical protein G6F46_001719 [Rhizopus delemar]|uniref:Uncharacterized protein n=2 Tax=Rhizopus TaxID=4842 RepID=A0A9P6ZCP7_9FUNG|nr:hypothetical protein G6F55_001057 [Rhizopus delemar]KAG1542582.1 hypothetical protein G6F51_007185 [Rhizopus arrhizus]KAG1504115.1 hypothetical protein G6F54_001221 [Rhizopus delemar]KAG1517416.1 hypothetical protein G6F53_001388 [Rhizopus delemar]KAG1529019.1 hypothetical protein G6F52_000115 [Rhizopus delemar]
MYENGRFADEYSPDLKGFISTSEFSTIINTFNNVANQYPPFVPVVINPYVACFTFVVLIGLMGTMHYLQHTEMIIILPILFLCASMMLIAWRRQKQIKFEKEMTRLCSCMNATENVRGISFKLNYLTSEQNISTKPTPIYAITIVFDDRYNLLHHLSRADASPPPYSSTFSVQMPVNIYCPNQSSLK